jgi:purine-nucleoside phosphorylase
MGEQKDKITDSADYIKQFFPKNFKPETALILDADINLPAKIKYNNVVDLAELSYDFSKPVEAGNHFIMTAKCGKKDLLIYKNRLHFYDGFSMQDIGHIIYILKFCGVKKILSIDEAGHLNPRLETGDFTLIYDHINLMGDNPLIGPNDNEIGVRFPDMSDAYSSKLLNRASKVLIDNKIKVNESVYIGLIGPASETDAEARFYREIGADVAGYSLVPENIAAVHSGVRFAGIGLITRNLVADVMMEDKRSEDEIEKDRKKALKKSNEFLNDVLEEIINKL